MVSRMAHKALPGARIKLNEIEDGTQGTVRGESKLNVIEDGTEGFTRGEHKTE